MRVTLIAAQSLDGFITRHDEPGAGFASEADQRHFRRSLGLFDCSVMGATTYRAARDIIRAARTGSRRRIVVTRSPEQFTADAEPGMLEFTSEAPRALLRRLGGLGHRACALLGGAQIHRWYLEEQCVNDLWLTLEPRLFGSGTPLVGGLLDVALQLDSVERLEGSDSLLAKYSIQPAGNTGHGPA